jgi:hypothetical protein
MIVSLTWTPDNNRPQTLTADIPEGRVREMRALIGTPEWTSSDAVMWIPCRVGDGPMEKRLFRLARITAID